jgi:hypothetical protein
MLYMVERTARKWMLIEWDDSTVYNTTPEVHITSVIENLRAYHRDRIHADMQDAPTRRGTFRPRLNWQ